MTQPATCAGCGAERSDGEPGEWGKVYFRAARDKAHYTLEQRGAFFTAWCEAGLLKPRGYLKRRPLEGMIGAENVAFLISEGDLEDVGDGLLHFHLFEWYQKPLSDNARRQKAWRDRQREVEAQSSDVDAQSVSTESTESSTRDRNVTVTSPIRYASYSLSTYRESTNENGTAVPARSDAYPGDGDPWDALDEYHALTGVRPWGKKIGRWIREYEAKHGTSPVIAALQCEAKRGGDDLWPRCVARLDRAADPDRGPKEAPKAAPAVDTSAIAAAADAEIEAQAAELRERYAGREADGLAAFEALRKQFGGRRKAGTEPTAVADIAAATVGGVG